MLRISKMGIIISKTLPYRPISTDNPDDFYSINMDPSVDKNGMPSTNIYKQTTHWNRMLAPNTGRRFDASGNDKKISTSV